MINIDLLETFFDGLRKICYFDDNFSIIIWRRLEMPKKNKKRSTPRKRVVRRKPVKKMRNAKRKTASKRRSPQKMRRAPARKKSVAPKPTTAGAREALGGAAMSWGASTRASEE
jgi:hypothetical protein